MGFSRVPKTWPTWVQTVDLSIQFSDPTPVQIKAMCNTCDFRRLVDFHRLKAERGGDYSLINRRTRCRFTPGCTGWVRFFFLLAVFRPLWDDETSARWSNVDWVEKMKG